MADPGFKMELVTRDFNLMLEELASIDPRIEFGTVVKSEAASAAAGAAGRTKAASIAKINARAAAQKFTTLDGKTYYIDRNYRDRGLAQRLQNARAIGRVNKLNARGIGKQSFVSGARSLGAPVKAPAYVLTANYKGRQYPQDGSSMVEGTGTGVQVTLFNSLPYGSSIGTSWALLGAMSARSRFFERNMAHFAFNSLATRAKKYPGIFTSPVPAFAGFDFDVPEGMFGS